MVQAKWIVSARYDLTFFIGSVLVSYGFMAAHLVAVDSGFDAVTAAMFFRMLFFYGLDQPHILQTAARVYADEEQFAKIRYMATIGLALICLGMLFAAHFGLLRAMRALTGIIGSFHIVRQDVGFLKAYRRVNGDDSSESFDVWIYSLIMFACLIKDYSGTAWRHFGVPVRSVHGYEAILPRQLGFYMGILIVACVLLYVASTWWRYRSGKVINLPKLLFMGATGSLHTTLFFANKTPQMITPIETAYHDLQYHGWMAEFQKRRFAGKPRIWQRWLVGAAVYSALSAAVFLLPERQSDYLHGLVLGAILFHYIIDGEIWKFSEDARLRAMFFPPDTTPVVELIPAKTSDIGEPEIRITTA